MRDASCLYSDRTGSVAPKALRDFDVLALFHLHNFALSLRLVFALLDGNGFALLDLDKVAKLRVDGLALFADDRLADILELGDSHARLLSVLVEGAYGLLDLHLFAHLLGNPHAYLLRDLAAVDLVNVAALLFLDVFAHLLDLVLAHLFAAFLPV